MSKQSNGSAPNAELAGHLNDSMSKSQAEAAVQTDEANRRAIEARNSELLPVPRDALPQADASQLVREDLIAFRAIENPIDQRNAAGAMGNNADNQAQYKTELVRQDPQTAEVVVSLHAAFRARLELAEQLEAGKQQARDAFSRFMAERQAQQRQVEPGRESAPDLTNSSAPQAGAASAAEISNSVDVQRSGRELQCEEMIVPRRIVQAYTEVNGKFFAKDSNRLMFEDKGEKLATSTTDKEAIADMVAYARAKQWNSLKLTGSQEFRREAWLQAESQGIRTQGYTPKESDLAALKSLTQERSTNAITPLQERKRETPQGQPPATAALRHDINKDQAVMHAEASKNIATNMQALTQRSGMNGRSAEELTKLAYWRGIVQEETKLEPARQEEAVARFDKQAEDPQFLKRLNQETRGSIDDKTTDRVQERDMDEHTL